MKYYHGKERKKKKTFFLKVTYLLKVFRDETRFVLNSVRKAGPSNTTCINTLLQTVGNMV